MDQQSNHLKYMQIALDEAQKAPPKSTNFCVGACLVADSKIMMRGYTLELPGNTHAEQCCFIKLAQSKDISLAELGRHLPMNTVLYTTMEPCNKRSVGNEPCVDRILSLRRQDGSCAIRAVYVGVWEPEKFVGVNEGRARLEDAGVSVHHVPGLEARILEVATAGHEKL